VTTGSTVSHKGKKMETNGTDETNYFCQALSGPLPFWTYEKGSRKIPGMGSVRMIRGRW